MFSAVMEATLVVSYILPILAISIAVSCVVDIFRNYSSIAHFRGTLVLVAICCALFTGMDIYWYVASVNDKIGAAVDVQWSLWEILSLCCLYRLSYLFIHNITTIDKYAPTLPEHPTKV